MQGTSSSLMSNLNTNRAIINRARINNLRVNDLKIYNPVSSINNNESINYTIDDFILKNINEFDSLGEEFEQYLHLNNNGYADVSRTITIKDKDIHLINSNCVNCFANILNIEVIDDKTVKFTVEDRINILMYTTYTEEKRFIELQSKYDEVKECSLYMFNNGNTLGSQCIISIEHNIILCTVDTGNYNDKGELTFVVHIIKFIVGSINTLRNVKLPVRGTYYANKGYLNSGRSAARFARNAAEVLVNRTTDFIELK